MTPEQIARHRANATENIRRGFGRVPYLSSADTLDLILGKPTIRRTTDHPRLPWRLDVRSATIFLPTFGAALVRLAHWYRYDE